MADTKFPVTRASGIEPADLPAFKPKYNQSWGLQDGEGQQDLPGNPLNNPVKLRKGEEPVNGWQTVASDTNSEGEDFGGKGPAEQR